MITTIQGKKIQVTLKLGKKLDEPFIKFIEDGLNRGFNFGYFPVGKNGSESGKWKLYRAYENYFEKLMQNEY